MSQITDPVVAQNERFFHLPKSFSRRLAQQVLYSNDGDLNELEKGKEARSTSPAASLVQIQNLLDQV
jgi:hypothetical protein